MYERQNLRRAAACGTFLYAAHRPAARSRSAAGHRQFLYQRDHAGDLRPDRHHPPGHHALHRAGHHEPVRQRGVQQPGPAVRHGRGHRYGQERKRSGRPVRRHRLPGHEHRHQRHDQRRRRCGGHGCQHHHLDAGHHHPADGRLRRYHRGPGRGRAAQPLLQDPAAPGAFLLRRHPVRPHRLHRRLSGGGHCHVLHLAGGPDRHRHAGQSGAGLRLRRHLAVWPDRACADPLRPASRVLYPLLADQRRRHRHHRRCDRAGRPEHLLCRAGQQSHHGILCLRHPVHGR